MIINVNVTEVPISGYKRYSASIEGKRPLESYTTKTTAVVKALQEGNMLSQEIADGTYILRDFSYLLKRHETWSRKKYGSVTLAETTGSIRDELYEIDADPTNAVHWVDVIMKAMDGALRAGHTPLEIAAAFEDKHHKNVAG